MITEDLRAEYRCCACGHTWKQEPEPTVCRRCLNRYVHWVNYSEELIRKRRQRRLNKKGVHR